MGNALPTEKLDTHNYASWEYKLHQYLVGQGCWSYIEVSQETAPDLINPNYPTRQQGASKVMYCLETCVQNHMLSYIRDANAPKETWKNLKLDLHMQKLFSRADEVMKNVFTFFLDKLHWSLKQNAPKALCQAYSDVLKSLVTLTVFVDQRRNKEHPPDNTIPHQVIVNHMLILLWMCEQQTQEQ